MGGLRLSLQLGACVQEKRGRWLNSASSVGYEAGGGGGREAAAVAAGRQPSFRSLKPALLWRVGGSLSEGGTQAGRREVNAPSSVPLHQQQQVKSAQPQAAPLGDPPDPRSIK